MARKRIHTIKPGLNYGFKKRRRFPLDSRRANIFWFSSPRVERPSNLDEKILTLPDISSRGTFIHSKLYSFLVAGYSAPFQSQIILKSVARRPTLPFHPSSRPYCSFHPFTAEEGGWPSDCEIILRYLFFFFLILIHSNTSWPIVDPVIRINFYISRLFSCQISSA